MDEELQDMVEHDCEEHAEYYEFIDELVAQGVYVKEYKYHHITKPFNKPDKQSVCLL